MIITVMNTTQQVVKIKPEQIQGFTGCWCSALPTELTSQLGAGHFVGSYDTHE